MNREALNAYDLGLPLVVAPVEERCQRVWAMVQAAKRPWAPASMRG
jgi:hypothetical protein